MEPFAWAKTKRYQPAVNLGERIKLPPKKSAAKKRPNPESASSIAKRIRLLGILAESETRKVCSSVGFPFYWYRVTGYILSTLIWEFHVMLPICYANSA